MEAEQTGMEITPAGSTGVARANGQNLPDAPASTNEMIWRALKDEDISVEKLERLVALQERVSERNARAAFFQALADFHEACPPIKKTRENAQFKVTRNGVSRASKYAPLEEIDRVARPVASDCGLVWTWDTDIQGDLMLVTCRVMHVDGHSESASVTMPHGSNAGASPQQKFGGTQQYGMRYSLIAALGLTTADDDVDGAGPAAEASAETITAEHLADLEALMEEVGADRKKFLRFMQVEKLDDIRQGRQHADAVSALEQKRRGS